LSENTEFDITQLLGMLGELDLDKIFGMLGEIDIEKLLLLLKTISEKADSLIKAINTIDKLQKSGILPIIDVAAEMMDENFNALARMEIMKPIANLMILFNLLGRLDQEFIMNLSMTLPKCIEKAKEAFDKTEKGMGTFELVGTMKKPEMAAAIKSLQELLKCVKENC
jgi:uncharacterized protein YjgD (DUF1641 family)